MCDEVHYALVPSDYAAFFRHCANSSPKVIWSRRLNVLMLVCLAFAPFLVNAWIYADSPPELVESRYPVIAAGCVAVVLVWQMWQWSSYPERLVKRTIREGKARDWFERQDVQLTPENIVYSCRAGTTVLRWHAVWSIDETSGHLFLRVGEEGIIIPNTAFVDDASRHAFVSNARRHRRDAPASLEKCPQCGYDLRGAVVDGCPECGWRREAAKN